MGAFLLWDGGSLFFDVVTQESHTKSNTITEHPVEDGADITDHVRPNLVELDIEGFISNTPVYSADGTMSQITLDIPDPPTPPTLNGAINLIGKAISGLLGGNTQTVANVMTLGSAPNYVAQVESSLEELRTKAILVSVVCSSRTFENMLIESCEVQRDKDSGTGATFSIHFKEIRTIASSVVAAPKPTIPRANINQQKGAQAAIEASQTKKSVLQSLISGLGP